MLYSLRVILVALSFYLIAGAAHAGPFAALIPLIGSLMSGAGLLGAITKLLIGFVLNLGMSLLQKALAKKPDPVGVTIEVRMGDDEAFGIIVGNYATPGLRKYIGTWGNVGKTPNAFLVDVIELGNIPNRAGTQLITSIWIDDKKCEILWDEPHVDGRGFPVKEYRVGSNDFLWIKFFDGTQTTVDAYLKSKFGTHPERPWKDEMIGRGVQYMVVTARHNTEKFSGVPAVISNAKPVKMYDLRKDSTNGGSGTQRWDDPTTWTVTYNPVIIIYNIIRGIYYGTEWLFGGQNLAAFRLPASNWIAAANECDVIIKAKIYNAEGEEDGEEDVPQFRAGYEIRGDMDPLDVIDSMRQACNARIAEAGGIFKILVGAPGAAVYSFTDDEVLVTRAQSFEPFPGLEEIFNGIEAVYPEPNEKWGAKDAPARYSEEYEEADGDRRLVSGIQFTGVPYADQVQRLMRAMIEEERRFRVHSFYLPPDAYPLEPNDVVSWTSQRNGYINKKFLVIRIEGEASFNQLVVLKEIDPSDYDWSTSFQLPTHTGWTGDIVADPQPMDGWVVVSASIPDATGTARRPALRVACAGDLDDIVSVQIQVRVKSTLQLVRDVDQLRYDTPYSWLLAGDWLLPSTTYEVRGKLIPGTPRATIFSNWITVTTDNLLIIAEDVLDNAITAGKIADAAVTANKIANEAVTNLKIAAEAVTTAKIAIDAVTRDVIKNGEVISSKIADAAITIGKFATGIQPVSIIAGTTVPTTKTTEVIFVNGKIYRWNGTAYIAAVNADDITGTLTNAQIESLAASKVTGQLTNAQIEALAAAKITGQLISSQIADAAITTAKFASTIKPIEIVGALPGIPHVEGRTVFLTTDDKIYRNTGAGWISSVPATDISGLVQAAQIAALAATQITGQITGTQIADNAISTPKLAAGSVIAGKIATGAVLAGSIAAGAVTTDKLDALAVTADKIATNAIVAGKIAAGAISATEIAAGAIVASKLAVGDFTNLIPGWDGLDPAAWELPAGWSIVSLAGTSSAFDAAGAPAYFRCEAYATNAYSRAFNVQPSTAYYFSGKAFRTSGGTQFRAFIGVQWFDKAGEYISTTGVTTSVTTATGLVPLSGEVVSPANAVTAKGRLYAYVESDGVAVGFVAPSVRLKSTGELIVDGAITTDKLTANAVTTAKIAANAVTANEIAANAITAVKVSAGAIETAKLATGAVVADKIAAGAITTAKLDALAVTADKIATNAIVAGKIAAGAISASEIAAGAVTASKLFLSNFTNLIPDSEFQDASAWALFVGGTLTTVAASTWGDGATGALSANDLLGDGSTTFYNFARSAVRFPVQPGKEYFYSLSLRRFNAGIGVGRMAIYFYDRTGAATGNTVSPTISSNSSIPQTETGSVVVPAGTATAEVAFQYQRGAASGVIIRSASINEKNAAKLIVDGEIVANHLATNSVTTAKIAVGAVTATEIASGAITAIKIAAETITGDKLAANTIGANQIAANAITASKMVITDFTNIVPDWNVDDIASWSGSATWISVTTAPLSASWDSLEGGNYLRWLPAIGTGSIYSQKFSVVGGAEYYASYQAFRTSGGTKFRAFGGITWYDKAGAAITSNGIDSGVITLTGPQKFSAERIAPAAAVTAQWRFFFYAETDAAAAGFCAPTLRRKANGDLIVDGAITADKISANTITANKIVVGGIDVTRLANNAVTVVNSAYTSGLSSDYKAAGTPVTVQTLTIANTTEANAILLTYTGKEVVDIARYSAGLSEPKRTTLSLYRGATLLTSMEFSSAMVVPDGGGGGAGIAMEPTFALSYMDTTFTAASNTYTIRATSTYGATGLVRQQTRLLTAMAVKR